MRILEFHELRWEFFVETAAAVMRCQLCIHVGAVSEMEYEGVD